MNQIQTKAIDVQEPSSADRSSFHRVQILTANARLALEEAQHYCSQIDDPALKVRAEALIEAV